MLRNELAVAQHKIKSLEHDKLRLEDTLKLSQVQKEMMLDETDKIQNLQQQEINKLKNLLLFREQVKFLSLHPLDGNFNYFLFRSHWIN